MRGYACLQILGDTRAAGAQERMLYAVTAYMDAQGLLPCGREEAERTVCFAPRPRGWAVFDDCADRLDIGALNGLGQVLTAKLRTEGVGILCADRGLLLALYTEGRVRDTYIASRHAFDRGAELPCWPRCHGHAVRWVGVLRDGCSPAELAALFRRGEREGRAVLPEFRQLTGLDNTADFGFASLEEAALPGLITLYFRPSNVIKQSLWERLWHPARRAAAGLGMLFHRPRCSGNRET